MLSLRGYEKKFGFYSKCGGELWAFKQGFAVGLFWFPLLPLEKA